MRFHIWISHLTWPGLSRKPTTLRQTETRVASSTRPLTSRQVHSELFDMKSSHGGLIFSAQLLIEICICSRLALNHQNFWFPTFRLIAAADLHKKRQRGPFCSVMARLGCFRILLAFTASLVEAFSFLIREGSLVIALGKWALGSVSCLIWRQKWL